jgi:hypothetical protein
MKFIVGKIWIYNVGDIDLKFRFWKEKSVENVITLKRLTIIQFYHISYWAVPKNRYICIAKQCSHVEFP